MKSLNMKEFDVKFAHAPLTGGYEVDTDEQGRLYLKRFRELFDSLGVDTSAIEALSALRLASRSLQLLQERWADQHGLSSGRLGVLFRLMRSGDLPLGDLATSLDSTPRNITGLVDHLERDGLVERVPDPSDRRQALVLLTERARRLEGDLTDAAQAINAEAVDGLSAAEISAFMRTLDRLIGNLESERSVRPDGVDDPTKS